MHVLAWWHVIDIHVNSHVNWRDAELAVRPHRSDRGGTRSPARTARPPAVDASRAARLAEPRDRRRGRPSSARSSPRRPRLRSGRRLGPVGGTDGLERTSRRCPHLGSGADACA
ncbi:MAG TPA: hypothetical protein DEA69_10370 [Microbacterium sp.]|nr:hypothetical protein [Microbacterium sp.]